MNNNKVGVRNYFILVAILIATSFFIVKSFMAGILWGIVLAVSLWPVFEKISDYNIPLIKKGAQNNALLFSLLFSIIFLTPIFYSIFQLTEIFSIISNYISANMAKNGVLNYPIWFDKLPSIIKDNLIDFWSENIATSQRLMTFISQVNSEKIFSVFSIVWGQIFDRVLTVVVMIITLYFMIRNGQKVKNNYETIFSYWFSSKSIIYIKHGILALRGTINGLLLVGIVEGVILSIPLILGGISSGLTIGLIAGIAGVIPLVMPLVILPFIAYLFMINESLWAIIGLIDLFIVWFVFEHITKPQMISKYVKINTFISLIAMIGGMQIFGLVGLFLGPAIIAMAIGMIKELIKTPLKEEKKIKDVIKEKPTPIETTR